LRSGLEKAAGRTFLRGGTRRGDAVGEDRADRLVVVGCDRCEEAASGVVRFPGH
jgi:hypothetical protein